MFALENNFISLHIADDCSWLSLYDQRRGTTWQLAADRLAYRRDEGGPPDPLRGGRVTRDGRTLLVTFHLPEGVVQYRWRLEKDHVEVELDARAPAVESLPLPGALAPVGESYELALPLYQGVLVRGQTESWDGRATSGGHGSFGLAMGGLLAERGGLLVAQESLANWVGAYGSDQGGLHFTFEQLRCPVEGWAKHSVRLYPTDATVTAICKRYRTRLLEKGTFVGWEEKIARKPILEQLFGALMVFTGYNHWPGADYPSYVRRLKEHGFRSLLLYPVRMCTYSLDFKMGGDAPVWLSDEGLGEVKSVPGALVAPWAWTFEALDDGTDMSRARFRLDQEGKAQPNWRIDDYIWYVVCTPYQREHIMARLASDLQSMDWIHFDVNASIAPGVCFSDEHALHAGKPMGREAEVKQVQRLLGPETVGNRIVSSEGFVGHFASAYDIGSVKMMPGPSNATKTPVPMTMLVFHDACVHDWWEVHNYNSLPGWPIANTRHDFGLVGSGLPRLKAAIDALYGCPPNVFAFGRQYTWSNFERRETISFTVQLEDPSVQEALREALPVARLHQDIGRCELLDFRFLSEDRSVQATRFADGTEIVANLGEEPREVDGYGSIPGVSWRRSRTS